MKTNRHHVVLVTCHGYKCIGSFEHQPEALALLVTKDCRIGAVIYRNGQTGKRYSHFEARGLAKNIGI